MAVVGKLVISERLGQSQVSRQLKVTVRNMSLTGAVEIVFDAADEEFANRLLHQLEPLSKTEEAEVFSLDSQGKWSVYIIGSRFGDYKVRSSKSPELSADSAKRIIQALKRRFLHGISEVDLEEYALV